MSPTNWRRQVASINTGICGIFLWMGPIPQYLQRRASRSSDLQHWTILRERQVERPRDALMQLLDSGFLREEIHGPGFH
jgi:hypothetical protein